MSQNDSRSDDNPGSLSSAEDAAFRARCRAFLDEHAKPFDASTQDPRDERGMARAKRFQGAVADAGLAGLTIDTSYGGGGLTKAHEHIWREEYGQFPLMTTTLAISHGMCMPMLAEYGTEEQKTRWLPDIISARKVWCQMFSEPGAGSDVASLQSRAERDGDEWILNGQKVWTTYAHICDYGILIARTDPSVPKHAGISMFILDMNAPGVEVREIHQIDGGRHFNEVFFTDVRLPADALIGELNNGWRLATAMLMYERVAISTGSTAGIKRTYADRLIAQAQKTGRISDPVVRDKLMKLYSQETTKSLVAMQTRARMAAGTTPGPGASLGKLHASVIVRQMRVLANELVGLEADAWDPNDPGTVPGQKWAHLMLKAFQEGIAGGSDEIQRNIIGDRVLGLPREPSVDKGVPFSELKVGTQTS